jgi:transposase
VGAANVHDVRALLPTLVSCPLPGYGRRGRLPRRLLADRAYDSDWHEAVVRWLGIRPQFAQRGEPHGSGLGRERYVVERTIANLHQNRRLKVRYERRDDVHQAFLTLACIKLCWYRLDPKRK